MGGNNTGANNAGVGGNDVGGFGGGIGGGNQGGGGGTACAGVAVKGERIPLDMYIMLDRSGSMIEPTGANGGGPTKWEAVTTALNAFFEDPGSEGLGVGIQFFPTVALGTPETCTNNSQCGGAGPCVLKSCDNQGVVSPCNLNSDCGNSGYCSQLGTCANNPNYYCFFNHPTFSPDCGTDANGNDLGTCLELTTSFCLNKYSCAGSDYAAPAVEITTLNGAAQPLKDAIAGVAPDGATPTGPALDGAIEHARAWAAAHPDHKVVAVLATDGLPTTCTPQDIGSIASLAEEGKDGAPSILTFVIGVFGQNDGGAQQNLDEIAQQGGTSSAFFITDNQDVTAQFLGALQAIQGQTLSCEYQMPLPPDGSELDYAKVNVEYTPSSGDAQTVLYVGKESACDADKGGWYYDQDPNGGKIPTKILMCPVTCSMLKGTGGQVDIKIGCQTIVPEAE